VSVLTQPTLQRLQEMKLEGMAEALAQQMEQPDVQALPFEERLGLLVDHEWTYRRNRRLKRLLSQAKFRMSACMEDINYRVPRGLDHGVMRSLAACQWIQAGRNALVTGPTGVGKTYIACALGHAACRQGFRTRYYRVPRLLFDLTVAKGDGSYPTFMNRLVKVHLLILDDWGMTPLSTTEGRELLEIIEERYDRASTIVASQLPLDQWYQAIDDPTVADAILDRLVHNAHKITMKGESMRRLTNNPKQADQ